MKNLHKIKVQEDLSDKVKSILWAHADSYRGIKIQPITVDEDNARVHNAIICVGYHLDDWERAGKPDWDRKMFRIV